jgi:hypothetical protein
MRASSKFNVVAIRIIAAVRWFQLPHPIDARNSGARCSNESGIRAPRNKSAVRALSNKSGARSCQSHSVFMSSS